jgi:hypothetical protein
MTVVDDCVPELESLAAARGASSAEVEQPGRGPAGEAARPPPADESVVGRAAGGESEVPAHRRGGFFEGGA